MQMEVIVAAVPQSDGPSLILVGQNVDDSTEDKNNDNNNNNEENKNAEDEEDDSQSVPDEEKGLQVRTTSLSSLSLIVYSNSYAA